MKRFIKGQLVYQACYNLATVGDGDKERPSINLGAVIERQVDACGAKQITFFNRGGSDSTFGKSVSASAAHIHATKDAAFEFLKTHNHTDVICPDVYTDCDLSWFQDLKTGHMRIAQK